MATRFKPKKKPRRRIRVPKGVEESEVRDVGTIFLPDHLAQVKAVAWRGLSDDEIATTFGVDKDLFQKWKRTYPSFKQAIDSGRRYPSMDVERALYERATGYNYEEETVAGRTGRIVSIKRHAPPDVPAIKYWLGNRAKEEWRATPGEGDDRGKLPAPGAPERKSRSDLISSIMNRILPQSDNEKVVKK